MTEAEEEIPAVHWTNDNVSCSTAVQNIPFSAKLEVNGNLAANWKRFKKVWNNFEIASDLIKQTKEKRTATLLTCIGPDAFDIVDGLKFDTEVEKINIEIVINKLESFCLGEINETYERYVFNKKDREPTGNIDSYITALRT